MRSAIAALRTLVLPFGQLTGRRIVLDGVNGLIQVYDTNGALVGEITSAGVFTAFDPAGSGAQVRMFGDTTTVGLKFDLLDNPPHTKDSGFVLGLVGAGPATPLLDLASPGWDGSPQATLSLAGEDLGGNPAYINLAASSGSVDVRANGVSLGRGVLPGGYVASTVGDGSARAANVNTDLALTVDVDATRLYEVKLKGQISVGTASVVYAIDLSEGGTVGNNDGTVVDRMQRWTASETAVSPVYADTSILYRPTTGTKTLRVRNGGSGGTVTLQGGAGNERQFWITDIGAR